MKSILFICTGNYYRSRVAEELFNYLAKQKGLSWRAESRGLRENMSESSNKGPISPFAVAFLESLGVPIVNQRRLPRSLVKEEAAAFDQLICLDETEHRPMIESRFPELDARMIYWKVKDVQFEAPETALQLLGEKVRELSEGLRD